MLSGFEDDNRRYDKDGVLKWEYLIFGRKVKKIPNFSVYASFLL